MTTVLVLSDPDLHLLAGHVPGIHRRETGRHHACVSRVARGAVVGLGVQGCPPAIGALRRLVLGVG
ncbi:type II 3-dehydroquinate dehydratase [Blastococcus litoris]|uniref:type II 3-dehydroquinate dehydratase n=1 Tax=Blastococcus litoris TaxID=2171622 RepID=UPI000E308AF3|nr:type II 3-dehydroquinate dehydratase [Blastococcus litoris]